MLYIRRNITPDLAVENLGSANFVGSATGTYFFRATSSRLNLYALMLSRLTMRRPFKCV